MPGFLGCNDQINRANVIFRTIHENLLEPFPRDPSFSDNAPLKPGQCRVSGGQTEAHMSGSEEYTDVLQQADGRHHPISSGWTFLGAIALLVIGASTLAQFF